MNIDKVIDIIIDCGVESAGRQSAGTLPRDQRPGIADIVLIICKELCKVTSWTIISTLSLKEQSSPTKSGLHLHRSPWQ